MQQWAASLDPVIYSSKLWQGHSSAVQKSTQPNCVKRWLSSEDSSEEDDPTHSAHYALYVLCIT